MPIASIRTTSPRFHADDATIKALVEEAARAAAQRVIASFAFVDAFNPFAHSHHSDATSSVGVERAANDGVLKRSVAKWYGLEARITTVLSTCSVSRGFSRT